MKNNIVSLVFLLFFACSTNSMLESENKDIVTLDYNFYLLDNNMVQFEIDYLIPKSKLVFSKKGNGFYSDVTFSIDIIDDNQNNIYNDSWSDNIYVEYFEDTKSKKEYIGHTTVILQRQNQYTLKFGIDDYINHQYHQQEQNIVIDDYQYLSDIQLYIKNEEKYYSIDNLDNSSLIGLDTLWIKYQVIDNSIFDNKLIFEVLNKDINNVTKLNYTIDGSNLENYAISWHPIPLLDISYKNLEINCYYRDVHKFKSIRIIDKEDIMFDYKVLSGPMENYMFNRQEYIEYIDLDSTGKIEYIKNYWTKKNNVDLLNEFYKRVEYANTNFKKIGSVGSESDQGRVYIIFGKPLNIDFEFNETGEFEIWQYSNKRFIFINRYGYYECYRC